MPPVVVLCHFHPSLYTGAFLNTIRGDLHTPANRLLTWFLTGCYIVDLSIHQSPCPIY